MSRPAAVSWFVVVLVLGVTGIVALWPRDSEGPPDTSAAGSAGPSRDLAGLRSTAALAGCPAENPAAPTSPDLVGVRTTCLGDGRPVDLGAALAGRAALINVWATWCQPCRAELPALAAYASQPGAVPVLGVQVESDPADGLELLAKLKVRLPSVIDADGTVRRALRVPPALPASYVLTADGRLERINPPVVFRSAEEVRAVLPRYVGVNR